MGERTQVASHGTSMMIERSGPAVRATLLAHASREECMQFEEELRCALALAAETFDLSGPQAVLTHWHALATMAANPPTSEERKQIERAKSGDYSGLSTLDGRSTTAFPRPYGN